MIFWFFLVLGKWRPSPTPDFLETDPHYASASAWIPHLVWSDLAGHLHSDCPGQCFIRNERNPLGMFPSAWFLAPFQACHRLHLLLMLRCQRNQHRPPNNLFRKAHGCSSNPAGLQYPHATRNTCPIHLYTTDFWTTKLVLCDCSVCMPCSRMYGEYFTMPRRVTSSDGGGRLDILLSLRIGGGACMLVVLVTLPHVSF